MLRFGGYSDEQIEANRRVKRHTAWLIPLCK